MLSPINLEKRASIKETMNKIINQGKIKSPTIEKIANKTSYFTPKNYIIKKNKLFNSKENTKKEYSLFSSSTDSNFVNKSTTLKG